MAGLGAVAMLVPSAGWAQQRKRLVGFLNQASEAATTSLTASFREKLAALGWGPDKLIIENRWADGYSDRLPALAAELVRLSPDILMASSDQVAFVLRA